MPNNLSVANSAFLFAACCFLFLPLACREPEAEKKSRSISAVPSDTDTVPKPVSPSGYLAVPFFDTLFNHRKLHTEWRDYPGGITDSLYIALEEYASVSLPVPEASEKAGENHKRLLVHNKGKLQAFCFLAVDSGLFAVSVLTMGLDRPEIYGFTVGNGRLQPLPHHAGSGKIDRLSGQVNYILYEPARHVFLLHASAEDVETDSSINRQWPVLVYHITPDGFYRDTAKEFRITENRTTGNFALFGAADPASYFRFYDLVRKTQSQTKKH